MTYLGCCGTTVNSLTIASRVHGFQNYVYLGHPDTLIDVFLTTKNETTIPGDTRTEIHKLSDWLYFLPGETFARSGVDGSDSTTHSDPTVTDSVFFGTLSAIRSTSTNTVVTFPSQTTRLTTYTGSPFGNATSLDSLLDPISIPGRRAAIKAAAEALAFPNGYGGFDNLATYWATGPNLALTPFVFSSGGDSVAIAALSSRSFSGISPFVADITATKSTLSYLGAECVVQELEPFWDGTPQFPRQPVQSMCLSVFGEQRCRSGFVTPIPSTSGFESRFNRFFLSGFGTRIPPTCCFNPLP